MEKLMRLVIGFVLLTATLVAARSIVLAAPGQDYTARPGDPTLGKVWIENTPLRVEVTGAPTVTLSGTTVVQARFARQLWEYRVVTIGPDQDAAVALAEFGADGWEATGVQLPARSGTSVLLKRPR
jgi:hypothetical protein